MDRHRHYIYPDSDSLITAFACECASFIRESVELGRPVHIALSGGNTPIAVFDQLVQLTHKEEWTHIRFYWGDERCVSPEDSESNFGNAKRSLLDPLEIPGQHIFRIRGEEAPDVESDRYGQQLKEQLPIENGMPVFDWIWLGLGEDGHTVSIFPDQIELWGSETPCVVATHPKSGQKRISLTGSVINTARRVSFIAMGKQKSHVINEIVMKEGRFLEYPAFYVDPLSCNLEWYMDKDATSWL